MLWAIHEALQYCIYGIYVRKNVYFFFGTTKKYVSLGGGGGLGAKGEMGRDHV